MSSPACSLSLDATEPSARAASALASALPVFARARTAPRNQLEGELRGVDLGRPGIERLQQSDLSLIPARRLLRHFEDVGERGRKAIDDPVRRRRSRLRFPQDVLRQNRRGCADKQTERYRNIIFVAIPAPDG